MQRMQSALCAQKNTKYIIWSLLKWPQCAKRFWSPPPNPQGTTYGRHNCRCAHQSSKTRLHREHSFDIFLKSRCTQMARNLSRCHTPGTCDQRKGPSQSCAAYLEFVPEPLKGAVESGSGCRTAPHRPAPPRSGPSELPASGEGGRISALISLSQCDPPTRRGRGLSQLMHRFP